MIDRWMDGSVIIQLGRPVIIKKIYIYIYMEQK